MPKVLEITFTSTCNHLALQNIFKMFLC